MSSKLFDTIAILFCVVFVGTAVAMLALVAITAITGQSPIDFSGHSGLHG